MTQVVTEQQYRTLSGDLRTPPSRVNAALQVAQELAEDRLGRKLGLGTYTEVLAMHRDALVYPSATPIDPASTGYVDPATLSAVGNTAVGYLVRPPNVSVTYTGGYTSSTLPGALRMALVLLTQALLTPTDSALAAGARSVSMGDISITFEHAVDTVWPAGTWRLMSRYRYREAVAS